MGDDTGTGEPTEEQRTSAGSVPGRETTEWDNSPLYEAPAGPDNLADGVVAIVNTVVAAFRSVRRRVSSWRAGR